MKKMNNSDIMNLMAEVENGEYFDDVVYMDDFRHFFNDEEWKNIADAMEDEDAEHDFTFAIFKDADGDIFIESSYESMDRYSISSDRSLEASVRSIVEDEWGVELING